jgi:hypothetical protein
MSLTNITRAARVYIRAELMVARIRMRSETQRLMFLGVAVGLAFLGLILINVALYAALLSLWGPVWTPLALGVADLVLAVLAVVAAALQKPGPELAAAEEMRSLASATLEEQMQGGLSVPGLMGQLAGDSSTARLLVPLVTTLIGVLKKRKAKEG